jgi:hypothetical protein
VLLHKKEVYSLYYEKEKRKVITLLGVGVAFGLFVLLGAGFKFGFGELIKDMIFDDAVFTLICIILYPLGTYYNWRGVIDYATYSEPKTPADRYYTRAERDNYHYTNFMTRILHIGLAITLGWIPGLYKVYKQLSYLKKNQL